MSNTYKLTTLNDLLSIPPDRLDDFFKEFKPYIEGLSKNRQAIVEAIVEENGTSKEEACLLADELIKLNSMEWIDDDKNEIDMIIRVKKENTK